MQKTGCYQYMRKLLALPMLPAGHLIPMFNEMRLDISTDSGIEPLLDYINSTWLCNSTWSVNDLSVFRRTIRTNNDVEGWHRRLNSRARHHGLPLYLLLSLLHEEASRITLQVAVLLSEGKVERNVRLRYVRVNEQLEKLWDDYEAGLISSARYLRRCARLQLPI